MSSKTAAQSWAAEIVGQMSGDDRAAIREKGDAAAWYEGVSTMSWDASEGARPATRDVAKAIERLVFAGAPTPRYAIESRAPGRVWTLDEIGDNRPSDTYAEAEAAIDALRALGGEWSACEYRVVEV